MKTLKTILLIVIMLFLITPMQKANAQAGKIENAMLKMDEMMAVDISPFGGGYRVDRPANLPEEYRFAWKYVLDLKVGDTDEASLSYEYFLKEDASYFGFAIPQISPLVSVVDTSKQVVIYYFDQREGASIAMTHSLPEEMISGAGNSPDDEYTVTELPDKEFLGYLSKGYKIVGPQSESVFYFTNRAGIGLSEFGPRNRQSFPDILQSLLDENKGSLMMYLRLTDEEYGNMTITMECRSIEKQPLAKVNSKYTFK